jgi:hypothetical protein
LKGKNQTKKEEGKSRRTQERRIFKKQHICSIKRIRIRTQSRGRGRVEDEVRIQSNPWIFGDILIFFSLGLLMFLCLPVI